MLLLSLVIRLALSSLANARSGSLSFAGRSHSSRGAALTRVVKWFATAHLELARARRTPLRSLTLHSGGWEPA